MGEEEEYECRSVKKFSIPKDLVKEAEKKGIDVAALIEKKLREAVETTE